MVTLLFTACGSAGQTVATETLAPAARLGAASVQAEERATMRFDGFVDGAEQPTLTGEFSVDDGLWYSFDPSYVDFEQQEPPLRFEAIIVDDVAYVHSDLFVAVGVADQRDRDLWVATDPDDQSAGVIEFFSFLTGDLASVEDDPDVVVSDQGLDASGHRFGIEWLAGWPLDAEIQNVQIWLGEDDTIVQAAFASGDESWVLELRDQGEPVDIPAPGRSVPLESLLDEPGTEPLPEQEPLRPSTYLPELDVIVQLLSQTRDTAVLVVIAPWCAACDPHYLALDAAVRSLSADPRPVLVAVVDGPATAEEIAHLYDLVPSSIGPVVDEGGTIRDQLGLLGLPATVVLDHDGNVQSVLTGGLSTEAAVELLREHGFG